MRTIQIIITAVVLIAPFRMFGAGRGANAAVGPTVENALAADDSLAKAIGNNDPDGIARWLDKDWAVISGTGGVGEGPSIFPDGVRSGVLTRKTMELSEPRVRLFGDMALVTTKVKTSGTFQGKPFDVVERQTDVLRWENGGWKCVLTHETIIQHN
jgi:ketosteroid isomerase-like protein